MKNTKPTTEEIIRAKETLKKAGYINIFWSKHDIEDTAENMKKRLSEKDIDIIAEKIEKYHDANEGINWEIIECYINMFINEKKIKK